MARAKITLHEQQQVLPKAQLYVLVFACGLILGVANMDTNGISTILPVIADDLKTGNTISWAGTASFIANTLFSVLYGRLSDIFGRKELFIGTLALFTVGELICSFSTSGPMLYVLRALTGLSTGGITNLTMIIISDVITLAERGKYLGMIGSFLALGNIAGPFIAAGFAMGSTWRGFFWLMAPLGALSTAAAAWLTPRKAPTDSFRTNILKIDFAGSFTYSVAIVLALIPISGGGVYYAWDSPLVIAMLTVSVVMFMLFLLVEWKWAPLPMIPLTMFRTRDVCALFAQTFLVGWMYQTSTYFLPLYFQNLRGWSPLVSAGLLTSLTGFQVFVSAASGIYMSKTQKYGGVIHLGNLCCLLGSGLMIRFDENTHPAVIIVILGVYGIGIGNSNQPMIVALQAHTPVEMRAVVISCRVFFRFLGGACGVAASGAILQGSLATELTSQFQYIVNSAYSLPPLSPADQAVVIPAYMHSIRNVFISNTAIMAFAMLGSFFWKDHGFDARPTDPTEQQSEVTSQEGGVMQDPTLVSEKGESTYTGQDNPPTLVTEVTKDIEVQDVTKDIEIQETHESIQEPESNPTSITPAHLKS
ncbi:major facilitator superfamily domain-containing protein [Hypoxylon sp. NC1633]|nr:major facilitator superfamily domain-containing protein [Hypoxylon sp. NC1633]